MFTLISVTEYVVIALGAALLFGLCVFNALGALQQSGYAAKRYAHWLGRKGNMTRSRFTLLAFLIALSMLVLGIAFSFAGKWAGYVPLVSIPLFVSLYCVAERRALKVPLRGTARAKRVYALNLLVLAVLAFALIVGANALAYFTEVALISHLRYLPLALLPLLQPWLLVVANALEKPFSSARNKKYLKKAARILHEAKCVKIAITGSFAKTGVKSYLAQILSARYKVIATPESFNTPLGIARSVEKGLDCDFFIAEMGARHAGDVAELCELVQPDHCILTGICPQHLETFGSEEAIVAAKSEIFAGTKAGGFAVYGDIGTEKAVPYIKNLVKVPVGEHGECGALDVKCTAKGTSFKLALGIRQVECSCKLLGAHSAYNVALAAAMAYKLGMSAEEIAQAVSRLECVPHRLQPILSGGVTVLDDAYNANIRGAAEAVSVLRLFEGRKIVVTPGIVELGVLEEKENFAFGEKLTGLDLVLLVGDTLVGAVKNGYLKAGGDAEKLCVVPTLEDAKKKLSSYLQAGDTVLFLNDLPDVY